MSEQGMSQATRSPRTGSVPTPPRQRWYTGRSELLVAGSVLVLAAVLAVGTATMEVPSGTAPPGPRFFPIIVVVLLTAVGVALAVQVLLATRRTHVAEDRVEISNDMLEDLGAIDLTSEVRVVSPEDAEPADGEAPSRLDWRTVGMCVAGIAGFILLLQVAGWILSSAALFWVLSRAFGSARPLFDVGVSIIVASTIQLAFGAGLGLPLPAGILEGVVPWIS